MAEYKPDIHTLWPQMATRAGLESRLYHWDRNWPARGKRAKSRLERFVSDTGSVVLKIIDPPKELAKLEARLALQSRVARELGDTARAPDILAFDPDHQAILMQALDGPEVFHILSDAKDHGPWLSRLGAWLSAFHTATYVEDREFRPAYNARMIRRLMDTGPPVHQRRQFESRALTVVEALRSFEGLETSIASQHGDASLHNFVWSDDALWALDFSNPAPGPIGYDVGQLLVNYLVRLADHSKLEPGKALPPKAEAAFFEGYTFARADDPSIQTVLHTRLVTTWARFPARRHKQSISQQIRFARTKAALDNLINK